MLPVLNREAVRMAVKFGLAIGATVAQRSVFARKNYFYPDLPKGYQISQYEKPIVEKGTLEIVLDDGTRKTVGITRAHLEEDAGKSLHEDFHGFTGIDLNRAGTPLLEIVSEPDMRSAKEAVAYMKKIHTLVRYLEICDGNMQEGSFRCDANVSVRPLGAGKVRHALRDQEPEFVPLSSRRRSTTRSRARSRSSKAAAGSARKPACTTRTRARRARCARRKKRTTTAIFPTRICCRWRSMTAFIESVRGTLPELPDQKAARYIEKFGLSPYDAGVLTASREMGDYYEAVLAALGGNAKLAANWVMGELSAALNKDGLEITASRIDAPKPGRSADAHCR